MPKINPLEDLKLQRFRIQFYSELAVKFKSCNNYFYKNHHLDYYNIDLEKKYTEQYLDGYLIKNNGQNLGNFRLTEKEYFKIRKNALLKKSNYSDKEEVEKIKEYLEKNKDVYSISKGLYFPPLSYITNFKCDVFSEIFDAKHFEREFSKLVRDSIYGDWDVVEFIKFSYQKDLYFQLPTSINDQLKFIKKIEKPSILSCPSYESFYQKRLELLKFLVNKEKILSKYPEIVRLLKKGCTQSYIEKHTKPSIKTVNKVAKYYNNPINNYMFLPNEVIIPKKWTSEQILFLKQKKVVIELLIRGISQRKINNKTGVGLNKINQTSRFLKIAIPNYCSSFQNKLKIAFSPLKEVDNKLYLKIIDEITK
ncbi:trp operon repressor [Gramella lutea]|uniref:Trp operon repressor n=1 Tax=Christiangramia lutea TaxID=1607951 RepID=A0A9X2AAY9_9FLAO|nr:trp operon repressor [Christiangramia lutea]MCH4823691.1 trp operon repressor [Christiangramia lutea]